MAGIQRAKIQNIVEKCYTTKQRQKINLRSAIDSIPYQKSLYFILLKTMLYLYQNRKVAKYLFLPLFFTIQNQYFSSPTLV